MSETLPAEIPPEEPITAEEAAIGSGETDSAIGDDISTYTDSLRSSLLESLKENGRGYHKYRSENTYILPEDKREQDRLDLQHALCLLSTDNQLALAPISDNQRTVLDLGTGTGIWAIDFADQHPEADIIGIDLSAIQPSWVPPNCKFEIDDFDDDWTYNFKFSYIHARLISPAAKDFPKLIKQSFNALEDGGWLEMQDICLPIACDDESFKGTDFERWNDLFMDACNKVGTDPTWPSSYKKYLEEAGFENIEQKILKWPINTWPKDRKLKEIGAWNLINMLDGLEGFTFRLFMGVLGWSREEVELFLSGVRKDMENKKIHTYMKMYIVYGQKKSASAG